MTDFTYEFFGMIIFLILTGLAISIVNHSSNIQSKQYAKKIRNELSKEQKEAIKKRDNYRCQYPNCNFDESHTNPRGRDLHIDHIKPVSKGGTNNPNNLQSLCPFHNMQKHNR